jgi:hypothetical protein
MKSLTEARKYCLILSSLAVKWDMSGRKRHVTQRDLKKSELSSRAKLCVRWILGYDHPMKQANGLKVRHREVLEVTIGVSDEIAKD